MNNEIVLQNLIERVGEAMEKLQIMQIELHQIAKSLYELRGSMQLAKG